ncbi:MAG: 4-hydroxythreonine-4-phosphate dehydrogenase PdxA [Rudaea sp.]|uniref:4-hydroxythreonine-4-phosphate dehydrogenase PdxA n=1 Tax=Rudaea sp. TaxID=2136325 RepID=UPI0039E4BECF
MLPRIAITAGEPAGIGPELVAALAATDLEADLVAIADASLLESAAAARGLTLSLEDYPAAPIARRRPGTLRCLHVPLHVAATPGRLDPRNGDYVAATLARAADGCASGEFAALVTAPVQKSVIADAGIAFTGHTEFFAARAHCDVVMMLAAPGLRVALATTHLPLAAVPAAITRNLLVRVGRILDRDLHAKFRLAQPRLCALGLNPHAGESGHLGREEIDTIVPALQTLRGEGIEIDGPLPADTAFLPALRAKYDAYLAMYHDQGLPVLKALGFGDSVNVTLGLPWIRTSVDHGTALDLAGTGRADASSLVAATRLALELARATPRRE